MVKEEISLLKKRNEKLEKENHALKQSSDFLNSLHGKQFFIIINKNSSNIIKYFGNIQEFTKEKHIENKKIEDFLTGKKNKQELIKQLEFCNENNAEVHFTIDTHKPEIIVLRLFPPAGEELLIKGYKLNGDNQNVALPKDINYKAIAQSSPNAFVVTNVQGTILGANDSFLKLVNYKHNELINTNISELLVTHGNDKNSFQFDKFTLSNTLNKELQIHTKENNIIDISIHTISIDSTRYFTTVRNITDKKAIKTALTRQEVRYNKLFDFAPLGILYCNNKGKIIEINTAFLSILNTPSEEITKRVNLFNFAPLQKSGFSGTLQDCMKTGKTAIQEFEYTLKWSKPTYIKSYFIPVENNGEAYSNAFVIAENITAQKQYINNLKQAKENAQESERLKAAFLSNISHEIRTPLNAVMGFAQLFDCQEYSNEELMRFKSSIIKGSDNLLNLIEGIIKLSELQSGNIEISADQVSIEFLMNTLIEYGKNEIDRVNKDIQLLYEYTGLQRFIETDEKLILRVLKHLINNAVKFTDTGFIKIIAFTKNSNIYFCVQDTGIGISQKQSKYIFDKFRQAESSEADMYRGVGMGLTLSKEIISKLNGKITVYSEIGSGSTFEVMLPIK